MWYPRQRGVPAPPELSSPVHSQWTGFRSENTTSDLQMSVSLPALPTLGYASQKSLPDFKSERSAAEPIGFLEETAVQMVRQLQDELAWQDVEIETLTNTLRRANFQTHESALMMSCQVEPVLTDRDYQTRKREEIMLKSSDVIRAADAAKERREQFKVLAEQEKIAERLKHEEDMRRAEEEQEARRVEVANHRRERLRMLQEDVIAAEVRYEQRKEEMKVLLAERKKFTKSVKGHYDTEAKQLEKEAAENHIYIYDCERVLAGQSDKAEILRSWKRFQQKYIVFFYKTRRDAAQARVNELERTFRRKKRSPALNGMSAGDRMKQLYEEQDVRCREIQRAKHGAASRSMIHDALVRELLDHRERELQILFRATADDLQEMLHLRKDDFSAVIVEKAPEAKIAVQKILKEHKSEMEQLQAKLDHTHLVINQDQQAVVDAQAATARMRKERDVLLERLIQLKRKSKEQAEILESRETAVGYASLHECLQEVKRVTTYLDHVGHDGPDLAMQGFFVGNDAVRPSQQIHQREELTGLHGAMKRYSEMPEAVTEGTVPQHVTFEAPSVEG